MVKKTYRIIGFYFDGSSALRNEFYDLEEFETQEEAEAEAARYAEANGYPGWTDFVIVVPSFTTQKKNERDDD